MNKLFQNIKNVKKGKNVQIFSHVNLYDCEIGDNTKIGAFVEIQKGVRVGKNCKISSHSFICDGVTIEDNVFIGHHTVFTNDKYPRAVNKKGALKTTKDWRPAKTLIKKGAAIGSGAVILAGIVVGENALVGAGAVVTKDVSAHTTVVGNPARIL